MQYRHVGLLSVGHLATDINQGALPAMLPFFIAACDYTLIGEELYAASAYLSREPKLLGSLKAQDLAKLLIVICIFGGAVLTSLGWAVQRYFAAAG